jgi:hypothetical protein
VGSPAAHLDRREREDPDELHHHDEADGGAAGVTQPPEPGRVGGDVGEAAVALTTRESARTPRTREKPSVRNGSDRHPGSTSRTQRMTTSMPAPSR